MHLAIVDGFSTGRVPAQRLQKRGVSCVHVQSQPESHPYHRKSFQPENRVDAAFQGPVTGGSSRWRTLRGFAFEVLERDHATLRRWELDGRYTE